MFFPTFEIASSPKILLSDVKEGIRKGDLSDVRIFEDDKTTTFGDCINSLKNLIGEENTNKIVKRFI